MVLSLSLSLSGLNEIPFCRKFRDNHNPWAWRFLFTQRASQENRSWCLQVHTNLQRNQTISWLQNRYNAFGIPVIFKMIMGLASLL